MIIWKKIAENLIVEHLFTLYLLQLIEHLGFFVWLLGTPEYVSPCTFELSTSVCFLTNWTILFPSVSGRNLKRPQLYLFENGDSSNIINYNLQYARDFILSYIMVQNNRVSLVYKQLNIYVIVGVISVCVVYVINIYIYIVYNLPWSGSIFYIFQGQPIMRVSCKQQCGILGDNKRPANVPGTS